MANPIFPTSTAIPPTSSTNFTLPVFYVPDDRRDKKRWIRQTIDYITGTDVLGLNRPRRVTYQRWYDLYNDIFDQKEWSYVWGTFGDVKPMTFTNYPLLNPLIQFITGQFMQQPLAFTAYKVNPNAVSDRMDLEAELTFLKLIQPYWEQFQQQQGMQLTLDERMSILPDDVKTYMTYDYRDMQEKTVTDGLTYILTKHNVHSQFAQMLMDLVISGDEFYEIVFKDGDPVPVRVDPRIMILDRPPDEHIYTILGQDWHPQFGYKETYMNPQEILYNYEYYMDDSQKNELKNLVQSFVNFGAGWVNQYNSAITPAYKYYYVSNDGLKIRVVDGQFIARNKMQFPKDFNEKTNEPFSEENGHPNESEDIMDRFDGVKIGHNTYCKLQRGENILRQGDNYRKCSINYGGAITRFGLYSKCYMLQMLYNIVMSHCEFAINQAGGKAIVVYTDDFPLGEDGKPEYDLRELAYQAKVQGFILRQRKEGNPTMGEGSYQQVDFGLSSTITNLIQMKIMIEQTVSRMTGISPDQLGFTNPYQTAKATQSNIVQSNAVLQPIYYVHSKVIETALQKCADLLKVTWSENTIRSYVLGDFGMKVIQGSNDLLLSDFGIFLQNNFDDANKKANYLRIGEQAMATEPMMWKEIIQVMEANSSVEAKKLIEQGMDSLRQVQQMKDKQMADAQQQNAEYQAALLKQKSDDARYIADTTLMGKKLGAEAMVESAIIGKEATLDSTDMKMKNEINKMILESTNTDNQSSSPQNQ